MDRDDGGIADGDRTNTTKDKILGDFDVGTIEADQEEGSLTHSVQVHQSINHSINHSINQSMMKNKLFFFFFGPVLSFKTPETDLTIIDGSFIF